MSITFDPYKLGRSDVKDAKPPSSAADDVLFTNPTALRELETYWGTLPRQFGIPNRQDVDPNAMGRLLEDSFILEQVAPGVARIRVAGRNIGKLTGFEPRGLPLTSMILPQARAAMAAYIEAAFCGPNTVEVPLISPRGVGQPALQGKMLLLPLRDNQGVVSRMLGALVMSGRRGSGGRRFEIAKDAVARVSPIVGLHAVPTNTPGVPHPKPDPHRAFDTKKAKDRPALRLVVSNPV